MNYFNKSYINTKSQNNLKKTKTERSNLQLNYNKKNQNKKNRAKNKTPLTTVGTVNSSVYEENKINDNIKELIIEPDTRDTRETNPMLIKPDYSKYLTRQNFYPKTLRIEPNKERLTCDELLYETKTSFRDNKMLNNLYQRAFRKCNYQPNLYDNLNNDKNQIY